MTARVLLLPTVVAPALGQLDDVLQRVRDLAVAVEDVCEACGAVGDDVHLVACDGLVACELDRDAHERSCWECQQIARQDAAADLAEDDALDLDRCGL